MKSTYKRLVQFSKLLAKSLLVFVLILTSTGALVPISAQAALANCGTAQSPNNTAQNSLTVAPSHGAAFYIDSAASQQMDSEYIAYRISSSVNYQSLWVSLDNFSTGSVISLVNPADSPYPIDSIVGGAATPTTVYFLLKATMTSNSPQKHDFKIYQGRPNGQAPLYACTFTFTKVRETIKANANKVTSVNFSTTTPNIGGTFQVSIIGNTGTIGSGSSPDNDSIWLSPAPQSNWPTRAIRLERVDLLLDDNPVKLTDTCGSGNTCYQDQLVVNGLLSVANTLKTGTKNLDYLAKYTYRVIGRAPAFTFKPIALISSGTQMKHSPISSTGSSTGTLDLSTVNTKLVISQKSITSPTATNLTTKTINGTVYMGVDYKIVVQNTDTSTSTTKIDAIVDTPDPNVLIDTTTATTLTTFTTSSGGSGTSITPAPTVPNPINGSYTFTTPVTIVSGGRVELTYRMLIPQCPIGSTKTYVNYVVAKVGGTSFGSATAGYAPDATLQFSCGTNQLTTTTSGSGTRIPFDVTTNPASSIGNNSATLNGAVNSYGVNGKAITFEYWSSPSSVTTVTATPGTTTTSTDPVIVTYSATGLTQGTLYYFRVISDGNVGATLTFATTEPVTTPTVTTDPPTGVTASDATLNGTVDPNQTPVYFSYEVYTDSFGSSGTPYEYRIFDDLTLAYNNSTNPYTQYAGSYPVQVPINMSNSNLVAFGGTKTLSSLIKANDNVFYRSKITYVTGGSTITGSWQSFKMTTYLAQTITWNSITDIQWGASAPTLNPTASSGMTVTITLDPSSTGCTYSGGVLTITKVGTCTLLADQSGGLKSGTTSYYNAADQVPLTFNILANEVTVTAAAKSKYYGDSDPTLTYSTNFTVGSLKAGDAFSGSLSRAAGGNVGTYAINQGTLDLGTNYIITFVSANLTINARPITVTADAKTKVYGEVDPALTYVESCSTSPCRVGSDTFTGAISRASGENAGTYAIGKGTLALNSNYAITYVGANLVISPRPITLKADNLTKQYNVSPLADPTFTYSVTSGSYAYSDSATAVSITRASGETVGDYTITIGAVTISPSTSNYTITKQTGTLSITDKTIPTITWSNPSAITYGTVLSSTQLNAVVSSGGSTLSFLCTYTPALGETLTATTHTLSVTCAPQTTSDIATYTSVSKSVEIQVNPKPITVVAVPDTKVYGAVDPTLRYTCTTSPCLVGSDAFTGALSHTTEADGSEIVKQYDITQGTLAINSNYTITFTSAKFTITAKPITISVTADNKVYDGNTSATVHTGSLSGVLDADAGNVTFSGSITGVFSTSSVGNSKTVSLTVVSNALSGTAAGNYSLSTPTNPTANITKKSLQITAADVTVTVGSAIGSIGYTVNSGDLVGGDTSSVVTGITCTTDYVTSDAVGASRTTSCSGGSATNYDLNYVSGLVTITAAATYTITFDINGGTSGTTSNQTGSGSVTLNANGFSKSGYTFLGWSSSSGGSKEYDNQGTYSLSADVTLYAIWQANAPTNNSNNSNNNQTTPVITSNAPVITGIAAKEVCATGVTLLIEGSNLAGASVTLDGTPVLIASSSNKALLLELPAGGIGTKTLKVFNSDGSAATSIKYVLVSEPVYYNFTYPETYKDSAFSYTFAATNAYGYAAEGALPDGLFLNASTGEVYGTPSKVGDYKFALVALNPCGNSYLDVYMYVDKAIPQNYTCNVAFNIPTSNVISTGKRDALKSCLSRIITQGPTTIDPVIFLSGGVPLGSSIDQMIANPRYTQIVDIIDSLNIVAQIYVGAFSGPSDQVQVMVYWPVPLDV